MRLFLGVTLFCLLAGNAMTQRGGGGGGFRGGVGGGFGGGVDGGFRSRLSGLRGRPESFRGGSGRFDRGINQTFGIGYDVGGFSDYGWGYSVDFGTPAADQTPARPSVIVIPPLNPPAPPPPPAHAVISEYHWPTLDEDASAAVFSIVTSDGAIHCATMVWMDGNLLRFTTCNGTMDQVLQSSISRDRTHQANVGKNLKVWLP
jgi:hypothetical protein